MPPKSTIWTLEDIAILREGYGKRSATLLSHEIGRSRNAVVGKAFRLGLSKNKKPGWMPMLQAPRPPRSLEVIMPKPKPAVPIPPKIIPEDIWQPFAGTVPVPLIRLERDHCRWPVHGGFCGCVIFAGSYCAPHFKIACTPARGVSLPVSNPGAVFF